MAESRPGNSPDVARGDQAKDIAETAMGRKDLYRKLAERGVKAKIYITLNTEYVVGDDGKCVAAIDRHSDLMVEDHMAIGRKVDGGLIRGAGGYMQAKVGPGASLLLDKGGLEVVTSTVIEVKEPKDFLDDDGGRQEVA